ncbi:discoidin domain-containing protein [Pelagicoccus enzymogenes]|uniref:discoidin domain-containing protein n=1 Tax=Pelagicoccus enzymogenes TaxID=2773457 RepID=UPI00280C48E3|nr:discoidin domain-containing protein [Pelagicoccus enzymogenes]MDQ8198005.1 discoidin domain-containing protein [Pelagicoccus enzymogenes]
MKTKLLLCLRCTVAISIAIIANYVAHAKDTIDLSGTWEVRLDTDDQVEPTRWPKDLKSSPITLPGTIGEAELGTPLALEPALTKQVFEYLHQRNSYIGAAWYSREIEVDESWANAPVELLLERVLWRSDVWLNGEKIDTQNSLIAPHRFDLGTKLKPGKNTLMVRIDNRMQVDIGTLGHAYTEQTQTIWNGILGSIELRKQAPLSIAKLSVEPQPIDGKVHVTFELSNTTGKEQKTNIQLSAAPEGKSKIVASTSLSLTAPAGTSHHSATLPADKLNRWSEFNPQLYSFEAQLSAGKLSDSEGVVSGIREILTDERHVTINGNVSFMRGTLDCAIFPKTGYPPTDVASWDKIFQTVRDYGLNHVRFHSWCPPAAAFESADKLGVYLQPELPNWTFKNGQDPVVDAWLEEEGYRILREYAHHPSFVFFSMGNELTGDYSYLDGLIRRLREKAPHLLYTSTTYSFSERGEKEGPEDDIFITQRSNTGWVRGQGFINTTWPTTDSDYAEGMSSIDVPLITHEVGQYNVYPNLAELPKYDGNLRALNFEAIKQDLEAKGRLHKADDYTFNSGKLAVILYKEDIERALRTEDLSGIQLLNLNDFPGQSTATVGILDAFWESKGLVTPEEFRQFTSPVVPLIKMPKMAWSNDETFSADIEIANFSDAALKNAKIAWSIKTEDGKTIAKANLPVREVPLGNGHDLGAIRAPLHSIKMASKLTVEVAVKGTAYRNAWNIWVYPQVPVNDPADVTVIRRYGKPLFDALAAGENVLFLPAVEELTNPLAGRFIPVFWSPLHFPNQAGSLGTLIDSEHPAFKSFPTDTHTDWQWWELLADSTSITADSLGPDFEPVMQFIDKYNRNSLPAIMWEAKVGPGKLFVCTLDLDSDPERRIVARQLKASLLDYIGGKAFAPDFEIDAKTLASFFQVKPYSFELSRGTSHPNHDFNKLFDGKADTFWHSDWNDKDTKHPYVITIAMKEQLKVAGLKYLPRQNSERARVADYKIETSLDGKNWKTASSGTLPNSKEVQQIKFKESVSTLFLRLTVLSDVSKTTHAAIAELSPIFDDGNANVDDLGLIDGFNN